MKKLCSVVLMMLCLALTASTCFGALAYRAVQLPSNGETFTIATGINSSGIIVGSNGPSYTGRRAVIWDASHNMSFYSSNTVNNIVGISNNGNVMTNKLNTPNWKLYYNSTFVCDGFGYAINNSDQILGTTIPLVGESRYFIWSQKASFFLLPPSCDRPVDFNDMGQIIGVNGWNAWYWSKNTLINIASVAGGNMANACDINNAGQVVGYSGHQAFTSGDTTWYHPFVWTKDGGTVDMAYLWGDRFNATYLNNTGLAAGYETDSNGYRHGYVVDFAGNKVELAPVNGDLGVHIYGLNDAGYIVGDSYHYQQGVGNIYTPMLWEPITVPEPSSVIALLSSLACLGLLKRKK